MTLLFYDPRFLDHDTGRHPEQPERLRQIMARLDAQQLVAACQRPTWEAASRERLELVHEPGHIDRIAAFAARGGGHIDSDTVVSSESYNVAALAAGAACNAIDRVVAGDAPTALCLV